MTDLVERLRGDLMTPYQATQLMDDAAARIAQLEAALREVMEQCPEHVPYGLKNQIRAALEEK